MSVAKFSFALALAAMSFVILGSCAIATASASAMTEMRLPYVNQPPPSCPPPGFQAKPDLDLEAYVDGRWFVQRQKAVKYLPIEDNFCVTARYEIDNSPSRGFWQGVFAIGQSANEEVRIRVFNYANRGAVGGEQRIGNLSAVVLDPKAAPAELLVGPPFIPRILWGPYWVIAAGPGSGSYEWALISGGPPQNVGVNGYCRNGEDNNNSGLWIFTRDPMASADTVKHVERIARGVGFDTTVLNAVVQQGCTYENVQ